jgi:hypothetical protein
MTETDWNSCTRPQEMLAFLGANASDRKLRLFACARCHAPGTVLTDERSGNAVRVAERYADGEATPDELTDAYQAAARVCDEAGAEASFAAAAAAAPYADEADAADVAALGLGEQGAAVLRDLIGNPFRTAPVQRAWLTPAILSLARAAYDEQGLTGGPLDPARLAVLADALEDAGCDNADLLGHLRGPGPHVRGCWAVDLLLGRE